MASKQKKHDGISLWTVHICLVVFSVILAGLLFFFTFHLSASFRDLTETSEQHIEMRKAALELMDSSDYLTECVQRFTVEGDTQFMQAYFDEAFQAHHREEAITRMSEGSSSAAALEKLQNAMIDSLELMNREYYAMRLVIEAKGYTDYPDALKYVELSAEDQALSAEDKMHLAAKMVLDDTYYEHKNLIRENMRDSLAELEQKANDADSSALNSLRDELLVVRTMIVLQTIGMVILVCLTARLGIHPIRTAVERIKADSTIPEIGAVEFRYLARTYNKMYAAYKSSLERLNFKATHDELTGVYNRSGYELLLSSIDLSTTYMILLDVDDFKSINDTYGHETGDRVLVKLVQALKSNFRTDDYICRIGGDEFIIFMVHHAEMPHSVVAARLDAVNRALEDADDGLPPFSISVGVVHGSEVSGTENLLEKTDEAMYRSKRSGKHTYTFYDETAESDSDSAKKVEKNT